MRFQAPDRSLINGEVFRRPPLSDWEQYAGWLRGEYWPTVAELNAAAPGPWRFAAQSAGLLADGLHYERRIAERGIIATRERNWHDLFNALIWLRYPELKAALNARQVAEIRSVGDKQRTRAQCALTHFDEAGAIVVVRDPELLALWDTHDWHGLFWRERAAWTRDVDVIVFGHALLEHALLPSQTLAAKTVAVCCEDRETAVRTVIEALQAGRLLNDPQELRPLPLSGIPGWHDDNEQENFYRTAPCFRPLREGRRYPAPL